MFCGQICPILFYPMNGNELIKILKKIGREKGLAVRLDRKRGKGSHFTLYFGVKRTIMKDRTKEISPGLLNNILANLGLKKEDIE